LQWCCVDVCFSFGSVLALCDVYSRGSGETRRVCYSWGLNIISADDLQRAPQEIRYLSCFESGADVVTIGCADEAAFCIVRAKFFHLSDEVLQDEKLEFLRDLHIM